MAASAAREPLLTPWLRDLRMAAVPSDYLSGTVLDMGFGSGCLASRVPAERYFGFDINPAAATSARARHPRHHFTDELPDGRLFDHVISLAVIEHTPDPAAFLSTCARFLAPRGRMLITTPNPALEWLHGVAAHLGLLSHEAHDEHQSILGRGALAGAAAAAGLQVLEFRYFMLGANQAVALARR